jgi:hypothetical protein
MEEPWAGARRRSHVATLVATLLLAGLTLAACNDSPSQPTRLVGANRVAVAVPANWKTQVEHGSSCPTMTPKTVQYFTPPGPLQVVGSCIGPRAGESWPAQDSVSIYTRSSAGSASVHTPHQPASGTVHGMPYYISNSRQSGPGVALRLTVPRAGVAFLVGAADRASAQALLATVRYVPGGTRLS